MRVAFFSPCGGGNLGDAAIQDAFMSNMHRRFGDDTQFVGITQNPEDTAARHGVPAVPMDPEALMTFRPAGKESRPAAGLWRRRILSTRLFRRARWITWDLVHWRTAVRTVRSVDVLAISGGGQLDDYWGGPWRHPYAVFKWTLLARLLRRPTIVLSVGAGTIDGGMGPRMTRFFFRRALRGAKYVSYRDGHTATLAAAAGLSRSYPTVPDLAFSHDARRAEPQTDQAEPTVALSPIAYLDPLSWPIKDQRRYESYLARLATVACSLREAGFRVVLCTSDGPDGSTLSEVLRRVEGRMPFALANGSISFRDTLTTDALLACYDDVDVVIASRLHGVILANIVGKPTIALSHDWKVDEHMRMMELETYLRPIGLFDPHDVVTAVADAYANREALGDAIRATCSRFDTAVQRQYDTVRELLMPTNTAARTPQASTSPSESEHHQVSGHDPPAPCATMRSR